MNVKNNKRRRQSQEKIEKAFIELLQTKELMQITVSEICSKTSLNRSTFYANYVDVFDLADKIRQKLESDVQMLYQDEIEHSYNSHNYLKLFYHIRENQIFYRTYFKLGFDKTDVVGIYDTDLSKEYFNDENIDYHIEFFRAGFNAIVKKWLHGGCIETPEQMSEILKSEYQGRNIE